MIGFLVCLSVDFFDLGKTIWEWLRVFGRFWVGIGSCWFGERVCGGWFAIDHGGRMRMVLGEIDLFVVGRVSGLGVGIAIAVGVAIPIVIAVGVTIPIVIAVVVTVPIVIAVAVLIAVAAGSIRDSVDQIIDIVAVIIVLDVSICSMSEWINGAENENSFVIGNTTCNNNRSVFNRLLVYFSGRILMSFSHSGDGVGSVLSGQ